MEYKIFREPLLFSGARVKRRGKRDVLISALEDVFFFSRLRRRMAGWGRGLCVCVCVCVMMMMMMRPVWWGGL